MKSKPSFQRLLTQMLETIIYGIGFSIAIAVILIVFVPVAKLLFNEVMFFWNLIP